MASINKVILIGNLGRDPEVRYMPSGEPVANITIATSSKYKSKTGELVEETEIAGEYLRKGRSVYVEGRLRTRKWQGQDGKDNYTTEVVAEQMQLLGGREGGGMGGGSAGGMGAGDDMGGGYEQPAEPRRAAPAPRAAAPRAPAAAGR